MTSSSSPDPLEIVAGWNGRQLFRCSSCRTTGADGSHVPGSLECRELELERHRSQLV